mmetsp:Transcript_44996/g.116536  ORF Transcript_44996/g.116536 Transcript_44996/m.116536 type:complete len:212 (+) Transcript_44996:993-1628(+)
MQAGDARSEHAVLLPRVHVLVQLACAFALRERHHAAVTPRHLLLQLRAALLEKRLVAHEGVSCRAVVHLHAALLLVIPATVQLPLLLLPECARPGALLRVVLPVGAPGVSEVRAAIHLLTCHRLLALPGPGGGLPGGRERWGWLHRLEAHAAAELRRTAATGGDTGGAAGTRGGGRVTLASLPGRAAATGALGPGGRHAPLVVLSLPTQRR